jgi:hypothetical protein
MGPAPPVFVRAHGVLGLPNLLPSRAELDEGFITAVQDEFPTVVNRQPALAQAPMNMPRLVLASTSSQLALSPGQADFEVQFYGDYTTSADLALDYIHRKIEAIRRGLAAIGQTPSNIGLIFSTWFSFKERDEGPAAHILKTHLRIEADPETVQDSSAKIALKVADKYFINLTVTNYESRSFQRPILPGSQMPIMIKPWEGTIEDVGIELTLDINNVLENRVNEGSVEVTDQGVTAVLDLLRHLAEGPGTEFVESGTVNFDELVTEVA